MALSRTSFLLKKYYSNYQGLSASIWQNIFIGLIESTLVGVCYFLTIYFVNELHLTLLTAGTIMSCYGMGTILGGIIAGKLSDKFSPRKIAIISLLVQGIAYLTLIKITSSFLLMLVLFIIGLGSYGFITSNHVWVLAQCTNNQRLKAINILDTFSNLGLAFAGLIIGCIATANFVYIFFLTSFALCITATYLMLNSLNSIVIIDSSSQTISSSSSENKKVFYFVLLCLFLVGFIIFQVNSTYPIYLQSIFPELGGRSFGILFALNGVMVVLLQTPLANYFSNQNRILLLGSGALLLGVGMVLLNVSYYFGVAILACVVMTVGEILFFSVAQLICYEKGSENKRGNSVGIFRMTYAASRVTAPLLGSFIYQQWGGILLWTICFLIGLACLISSFCFFRHD